MGPRDSPASFNGQLPFLIKDDTPRDERVPRERSHRNGAVGIRTLAIAVNDPGMTSRYYARALGRPGAPVHRPEFEVRASALPSVPTSCSCSRPNPRTALSRDGLANVVSPHTKLFSPAPAPTKLDPALLHGARMRFA